MYCIYAYIYLYVYIYPISAIEVLYAPAVWPTFIVKFCLCTVENSSRHDM